MAQPIRSRSGTRAQDSSLPAAMTLSLDSGDTQPLEGRRCGHGFWTVIGAPPLAVNSTDTRGPMHNPHCPTHRRDPAASPEQGSSSLSHYPALCKTGRAPHSQRWCEDSCKALTQRKFSSFLGYIIVAVAVFIILLLLYYII